MKKLNLLLILISFSAVAFTQTNEAPFTLDDRDRIMRTEQKVESLRNEMNAKFEAVNQKIDSISKLLYWALSIIIALILFVFGYIVWDRRTALFPIREKTFSLSEQIRNITEVLRELAKTKVSYICI